MCEAIGHPVLSLKRVAIGPLRLGGLDRGKWRSLTPGEVAALQEGVTENNAEE
jgi:16S rRNA U516 pseudouridylate synthase RsuA-like enzyme